MIPARAVPTARAVIRRRRLLRPMRIPRPESHRRIREVTRMQGRVKLPREMVIAKMAEREMMEFIPPRAVTRLDRTRQKVEARMQGERADLKRIGDRH